MRIVRVNDVGLEPLDEARQPPRGAGRFRCAGASGIRSSPSLARWRSSPLGCATRAARWPSARRPIDGEQHLVLAASPGARGVDVDGEHRQSQLRTGAHADLSATGFGSTCRGAVGRGSLQFPQFRELEEDVIRVQRRDDAARRCRRGSRRAAGSCAETPAADGQRAASGPVRRPSLVHLSRGERRVAIDGVEVIVRCRDRRSAASSCCSRPTGPVDRHGLVHVPPVPAAGPPVVEAELVVRIPIGTSDPATEVPGDARDAVAARAGGSRRAASGSPRPAPA